MTAISPSQVRTARALLEWTMVDLARAACMSVSTVKRYEDGQGAPTMIGMMQDALESEGVQFLADNGNGPGLRYRPR